MEKEREKRTETERAAHYLLVGHCETALPQVISKHVIEEEEEKIETVQMLPWEREGERYPSAHPMKMHSTSP